MKIIEKKKCDIFQLAQQQLREQQQQQATEMVLVEAMKKAEGSNRNMELATTGTAVVVTNEQADQRQRNSPKAGVVTAGNFIVRRPQRSCSSSYSSSALSPLCRLTEDHQAPRAAATTEAAYQSSRSSTPMKTMSSNSCTTGSTPSAGSTSRRDTPKQPTSKKVKKTISSFVIVSQIEP